MRVDDSVVANLEKYRDSMTYSDRKYVKTKTRVKIEELRIGDNFNDDESFFTHETIGISQERIDFERIPSLMELLEFMSHRSLKEQVCMIANLLTLSGFTQSEISDTLGIPFQSYTKILLRVRKDLRTKEL